MNQNRMPLRFYLVQEEPKGFRWQRTSFASFFESIVYLAVTRWLGVNVHLFSITIATLLFWQKEKFMVTPLDWSLSPISYIKIVILKIRPPVQNIDQNCNVLKDWTKWKWLVLHDQLDRNIQSTWQNMIDWIFQRTSAFIIETSTLSFIKITELAL